MVLSYGKYRLINAATYLNAVTIKDASIPPSVDEFSEEFAGYPLVSLMDLFSGYDQCALAPESRDLTYCFFFSFLNTRSTRRRM